MDEILFLTISAAVSACSDVRGHWAIENQLHYMLDVFWGEDGSRKRSENAAANFGAVLRIANNLVKTHPDKISIKRKRKRPTDQTYTVNKS